MASQLVPWLGLAVVIGALGCGSSSSGPGQGGGGSAPSCGLDERRFADGGCAPVGVPAGDCGAGFESNARGGCVAILPSEPCPSGQMAVVGETACRPVSDCVEGAWDFVSETSGVVYVDGSYTGANPDGTLAAPFPTITGAVAAAGPENTTVAIADGVYEEDIVLLKELDLIGRCPAAVSVIGVGVQPAAVVVVSDGARGASVRGMSVTGPKAGVGLASTDVTLEDLWIHDTAGRGVDVIAQTAPTSAVVRNVLIEGATEIALLSAAAAVVVERTVIRDTQPTAAGLLGIGVFARSGDGTVAIVEPASLEIRDSVVERSFAAGITLTGSNLTAQRLIIRDTAPQALDGQDGFGLFGTDVLDGPLSTRPAIVLDQVVVERSSAGGVVIQGGELMVARSTVVDTAPNQATGAFGTGIVFQFGSSGPTTGSLADSAVERSHGEAVLVATSEVMVDGSVLRETLPYSAEAALGDGLLVGGFDAEASVVVRGSLIEDNVRAGIASFGGAVTVGDTELSCNPIALNGQDLGGEFSFVDEGGNVCGCGEVVDDCQLQSAALTPPAAP